MNNATRCGYIAFLGAPNAGKSTLLNRLVGQKLAIVTPKAQTTRSRITGAIIHNNAQLIFADVPGIFSPGESKPFERAMVECAWSGAADADLVAMIVDSRRGLDDEIEAVVERLASMQKPAYLILNKIDLIPKERLLAQIAAFNERYAFRETFMISALKGDGLEALKDALAAALPPGPWLFPEDYLTDLPVRLIASEITREQCFLTLREELPYSLTVETESWEDSKPGEATIHQVILVEREGQKGIVLGKGGQQLKKIGETARAEITRQLGIKAHLFLFVKVRDWKTSPDQYSYLGLRRD